MVGHQRQVVRLVSHTHIRGVTKGLNPFERDHCLFVSDRERPTHSITATDIAQSSSSAAVVANKKPLKTF